MKTISLKKVSAVAVASLGFGLLSVVPVQAANITASITSINATVSTAAPKTNEAVSVNFGVVVPRQSIAGAANEIRFQAAFASYPVGGSTSITATRGLNGEAGIAVTGSTPTYTDGLTGASVVVAGGALDLKITTGAATAETLPAGTITSSAAAGSGSFNFTPTKAGTYSMVIWHDTTSSPNGELSTAEVRTTIDIVVAAASSYSNALSTAYMQGDNSADAASAADDLIPAVATKTMANTTRAGINILIKNSSNAPMTTGNTITAVISGSGGFGSTTGTADTPGATDCSATTVTRVKTFAADDNNTLTLCSDGTAGKGTVTIQVTDTVVTIRMVDPADSTKFLTTTVSFTVGGSATSVVLTVDKTSYAAGDKGTLTLTAKDASGNPVSDRARDLLSSTGLTGSKGLQGALPTAASVETKSGVKTYTFFAPVSGGAFSINGTVGTGAATAYQGTAITVSSSVTDGNAALLTQIDALNAKIVALNALIAKIMKKLGVK